MKLHQTGYNPAIEYLPAKNSKAYELGMALVIASGVADQAGPTVVPTHISLFKGTGATGEEVPAIRITDDMTLEAELQASGASLAIGNKVTLHTDGVKVTATTSSGVAEIVKFCTAAKAAGDKVLIKF